MISPDHVQTMARYNEWQNGNLIDAAMGLPDSELESERGAFWGSILKTFNHILWADRIWMARFEGLERPPLSVTEGLVAHGTLGEYHADREAYDAHIREWASEVSDDWLAGDLSFHSGAAGQDVTMPCGLCVTHFFNHQTHHRGQIHAMLTAAGAKPGDTDLFLMDWLA